MRSEISALTTSSTTHIASSLKPEQIHDLAPCAGGLRADTRTEANRVFVLENATKRYA